jgi:predicted dehydrogenase
MAERLRIGIIGCGGISSTHIAYYANHLCEETEIVAVCDIDEEKARARSSLVKTTYERRIADLSAALEKAPSDDEKATLERQIAVCADSAKEAAFYTDYERLIAEAHVDAVNICVPPFAHSGPTIAAAKAGKHVFCEGPIAGSLAEADAMVDAAQTSGVVFTVQYGHTRYHRTAMMAKKAIENGDLGRLILSNVDVLWYRGQDYYDMDPWRGTWKGECGGATYHHGRYAIDLYLWLMGGVDEIYARMGTYIHRIEVEDASVALLTFRDGALGQISASTAAHPNAQIPSQRVEIFGEKASMTVIPNFEIGSADKDYAAKLREKLLGEVPPLALEGMPGQFKDFVDAIRGRKALFIPGESTRPQLEVTKGIYKSVETGAPVRLPIQRYDPYYAL